MRQYARRGNEIVKGQLVAIPPFIKNPRYEEKP